MPTKIVGNHAISDKPAIFRAEGEVIKTQNAKKIAWEKDKKNRTVDKKCREAVRFRLRNRFVQQACKLTVIAAELLPNLRGMMRDAQSRKSRTNCGNMLMT